MNNDATSFSRRAVVAVRPGSALDERPRLFGALEDAFPVSFVGEAARDGSARPAATIAYAAPGERLELGELSRAETPVLAIGDASGEGHAQAVTLADCPEVDDRIRGIELQDRLGGPRAAAITAADRVLATGVTGPAWLRGGERGDVQVLSSTLPELGPEQILRDLFRERALALIALVAFLREAAAPVAYEPPPLRAAFLFDDPNLRWRTYGFIDYQQLVAHAGEHEYHASMAMVPLDGRFQHGPTIDLFRRNQRRLSLVFHGNNHVSRELVRQNTAAGSLALAAQAVRRAERFEARYGLGIDRVMTPPHGMCSEHMARALGAVGFAGLCAIHPLPWAEQPPGSLPLAGWDPAEFAEGCAVIPRLHLDSTDADIALRAFLDQPLIFYGHHEDVAGGLTPLATLSERVSRLGGTRWCSIGEIAASNFASRRERNLLRVRPYSSGIHLIVPADVDEVVVERPRGGGVLCGWSLGHSEPTPFGSAVPVTPGAAVKLRLRRTDEVLPDEVSSPPRRPWPILRKVAMEARDRTLPLRS